MNEEIAEIITERSHESENNLWLTRLSNGYVISTIKRDEQGKALDEALVLLMKVHGVTNKDLDRPAILDLPGDYETMVFIDGRGMREVGFARYDTEEEAEQGHQEMVERWRRMPSA